jgi:hypothetical protein
VASLLLRFRVGEQAILAVSTSVHSLPFVEEIVDVVEAGGVTAVLYPDKIFDYTISVPGHPFKFVVMDWQLRKIKPQAEPLSLTRVNEDQMPKEWVHAWESDRR